MDDTLNHSFFDCFKNKPHCFLASWQILHSDKQEVSPSCYLPVSYGCLQNTKRVVVAGDPSDRDGPRLRDWDAQWTPVSPRVTQEVHIYKSVKQNINIVFKASVM